MGEPARQESLCDHVVDRILQSFKTGAIVPGERLPTEPELAKHFNVSRTVIREAVGKLRALNMVTVRRGDGTYANSANISNLIEPLLPLINLSSIEERDIMETRMLLEPGVINSCAFRVQHHGEEGFERIDNVLQLMRGSIHRDNIFEYSRNEMDLKLEMAQFCHNSLLAGFMSLVVPLSEKQIQLANSHPSMLAKSFGTYTEIVTAVRAGDSVLAVKITRELLDVSRDILLNI